MFTGTFPKLMLDALNESVGTAALSCSAWVAEAPLAIAVSIAVWVVVTAATVAVNPVEVAPAGTVTDAGTVTALLLLVRFTISPPGPAAAVSITVQAPLPAPVNELVAQLRALSAPGAALPVPLRLIAAKPGEALLLILRTPLAAPATAGWKTTVRTADRLGFSVNGKAAPDTLNPAPLIAAELMINGADPDETRVTDCAAELVFTVTLPKFKLVALKLNPGADATRLMEKDLVIRLAEADNTAFCAVLTALTGATKLTWLAPAGTITEPGTATALLLLDRFTNIPFGPAGAERLTVHGSAPEPVIDL